MFAQGHHQPESHKPTHHRGGGGGKGHDGGKGDGKGGHDGGKAHPHKPHDHKPAAHHRQHQRPHDHKPAGKKTAGRNEVQPTFDDIEFAPLATGGYFH